LTGAGVLDPALSTASKRNEGLAGLSCASVARWVESRTSAVTLGVRSYRYRLLSPAPVSQFSPWLRFSSPLIEPDVRISRIRLSGRLHPSALAGGGPSCTRRRRITLLSPNTTSPENRRVPRDDTLCRLLRNPRTRS